jgi:hypothetical protein
MSRANFSLLPAAAADDTARTTAPDDSTKLAQDIGLTALNLAQRARAAGLTTICYLLECVALEAGAESAAMHQPDDEHGL